MTEPTFPPTDAPPPRTGGGAGYLRIATEEAFATPEIIKIWLDMIDSGYDDAGFRSLWGFYGKAAADRPRFILQALQDLGARDPVLPSGARRRPGALRHGLPV